MTVQCQFGIQQLSIDSHFKLPAIGRDESDLFDQMLIVFEQLFYQAHGPTGVVSDRAVNDFDFQHSPSANFRRIIPFTVTNCTKAMPCHRMSGHYISLRQLMQKRGDCFIGRFGFDLLRRPHLAQHSAYDHSHAITQLRRFPQIVCDKHSRTMIFF